MDNRVIKLYAAFSVGCKNVTIFESYYSLFAKIMIDDDMSDINVSQIRKRFFEIYGFDLPPHFVRQMLTLGIASGDITENETGYYINKTNLSMRTFDPSFESNWNKLIDGFTTHCGSALSALDDIDIESLILDFLDDHDPSTLHTETSSESDIFNLWWNSYIEDLYAEANNKGEDATSLLNYLASISLSNLYKDVLFYSNDDASLSPNAYSGYNVYLDSPIVFALLGMSSQPRIDLCKFLVNQINDAGCNLYIFDHTLAEIKDIMNSAKKWGSNPGYNSSLATEVGQYFHDKLQTPSAMEEFFVSAEKVISDHGIAIKPTNYEPGSLGLYEDETAITEVLTSFYGNNPKERTVRTDARSIVMVYHERAASVSLDILSAKHIMITLNSAFVTASKEYSPNNPSENIQIPTCISADLFGTILWLHTPLKAMEYQRKRLLADISSALSFSRAVLEEYSEMIGDTEFMGGAESNTSGDRLLRERASAFTHEAAGNTYVYPTFEEKTITEIIKHIRNTEKEQHLHEKNDLKNEINDLKNEINDLRIYIDDSNVYMTTTKDLIDTTTDQLNTTTDQLNSIFRFVSFVAALFVVIVPSFIITAIITIAISHYTHLSSYSVISVAIWLGLLALSSYVFSRFRARLNAWIKKRLHL